MKYSIILLCSIITCCTLIISCNSEGYSKQDAEKMLNGNHELRKFNIKTAINTESSAYFLLLAGGYNSSTKEESKIRMYFKNWKGEFQFLEEEFKKVKVKIDSTIKIPYITFDLDNQGGYYGYNQSSMLDNSIDMVTIHCSESDFKLDLNINDLK